MSTSQLKRYAKFDRSDISTSLFKICVNVMTQNLSEYRVWNYRSKLRCCDFCIYIYSS